MTRTAVIALLLAASIPGWRALGAEPAESRGHCVQIGIPKPTLRYGYVYRDSRGTRSEYTNQWEEVSATGTKVRTEKRDARGRTTIAYATKHHIEDDITLIERNASQSRGGDRRLDYVTTFRPAVTGDPAFRACAGKSWRIASVTATNVSAAGTFSARSDPGELRIVALHESVRVPAGTFDTVHYLRSTRSKAGSVKDEYWKSIEHGVIVKHHSVLSGTSVDETLQSIK